MNASPLPAPVRTAPIALWRIAEAFMRILYSLFGGPEDIAVQHTLTLKPYQLMASWLRVGEVLLRRLLLIEASAYPKPNPRPLVRKPRQRVRKELSFWPDKPEDWRVSFRCFFPRSPGKSRTQREEGRGSRFRSAWPLAERYEALIRVFNTPVPYARRLAARLHAAPQRVGEMLYAPREAEHRIENFAGLDEAAWVAWPAAPAPPNSS
ncbi:MAG: hypothetical protein K2P58_12070 [Hyphomonadaceae bacterium]|nr:hypothetical protein [Hyphomonadaceae bacterium]